MTSNTMATDEGSTCQSLEEWMVRISSRGNTCTEQGLLEELQNLQEHLAQGEAAYKNLSNNDFTLNIAVTGMRGPEKSTFINSLLGIELLPMSDFQGTPFHVQILHQPVRALRIR